ncbi:MAG: hypothetical protein ACO1SV_19795 [Fimbriimonas sp.]
MRRLLLVAIVGAMLGCGPKPPEPSASVSTGTGGTEAAAPKDGPTALQEQLRGGAYQIDAAMGAMERAMNVVRPLAQDKPDETREALQTIADMLDSAAATIVEFNDAPTLEAVREDFKAADDKRLKAIEEADDARQEVEQAKGVVTDLLSSEPPADVLAQLNQIDDAIEEALDALEAAIEAFGGKVSDPSAPDSGTPEE